MTASNVITKPANDLTDEEFLSRDIELIYDAVTDIYDLSKEPLKNSKCYPKASFDMPFQDKKQAKKRALW